MSAQRALTILTIFLGTSLSSYAVAQQFVPPVAPVMPDSWMDRDSGRNGQQHDPNDPNHWYPTTCCNGGRDCFPIPIDAVEQVEGGWFVKWLTPNGVVVHEKVPEEEGIKSQDGKYHGCWRASDRKRMCFFYPVGV